MESQVVNLLPNYDKLVQIDIWRTFDYFKKFNKACLKILPY